MSLPRLSQSAPPPVALLVQGRAVGAVLPLAVPGAAVLVWWLGTTRGWIVPQVLPTPGLVVNALVDSFRDGSLWSNVSVSLVRVTVGFSLSMLVGLPLGICMGFSPVLRDYLYPLLKIIAYVPLLAWLSLLVMILGIGEWLKYVLIAKMAFIPVTLNTYKGFGGVPRGFLELGEVYEFSRWQQLRHLIFPAAFSQIWTGLRYGLAIAWITLVASEYLVASEGVGYIMANGQNLAQMDQVLMAVLLVGGIGFFIDRSFALIERSVLRWRG